MKTILITGSNGAIGQALCYAFKQDGYHVVGTDIQKDKKNNIDIYIPIDLDLLCNDAMYRDRSIKSIIKNCNHGLDVLINNAATQILSPVSELSFQDWNKTININLNSVFILVKELLGKLEMVKGGVINISSIHAQLTKPGFTAYSTSKAGLIGLTKSFAVELGSKVRVNAISPAAILTPMLEVGFSKNQKARNKLDSYHPTEVIGTVNDIVAASLYLSKADVFINGSIINIDGGILSRLHDPDGV
jgi:NAD(P)-dependent dehydrogenase (short-subunit alcohol dehydrogenase family)